MPGSLDGVCAVALTTVNVLASTVTINDQAGVLDAGRVQADAAQLPDPMLIYTTKTFTGDQDALNQSTREQLPNQNAIAIGIDTIHRHLSIQAGTKVQLSDSQASTALSAFQSNYNGGDYTGATIAAIDSLRNTLSGGSGFNVLWQVLGVLAIILGIWVVFWVVNANKLRRRFGNDGPSRSLVYWLTIARPWNTTYTSSHGEIYHTGTSPGGNSSGNYGGGAGGGYGGGSSGGGAGGSF